MKDHWVILIGVLEKDSIVQQNVNKAGLLGHNSLHTKEQHIEGADRQC